MSRTWITCAFCREQFSWTVDPGEPYDVCGDCTIRIEAIAAPLVAAERTRLRALLLATAEKFGGPVQAALVELGEGVGS